MRYLHMLRPPAASRCMLRTSHRNFDRTFCFCDLLR
uniref:Uncharacterized protein n=1 Tax=Arundo donax TaxID=35708 RepID=A0A0A9A556_ARUDO